MSAFLWFVRKQAAEFIFFLCAVMLVFLLASLVSAVFMGVSPATLLVGLMCALMYFAGFCAGANVHYQNDGPAIS